MDFNVIDYLAYHADVAVPAIILMVIVSAIYLIFYGIRPIKTRFLILFLLSIVSLIIFVVDNPLYSYFGSPYSGLLFVFYYMLVFSVFYVPFSLIAFIKSLLHLIRFQTKYSILLVINSFFATLLAFLNLLFFTRVFGISPCFIYVPYFSSPSDNWYCSNYNRRKGK